MKKRIILLFILINLINPANAENNLCDDIFSSSENIKPESLDVFAYLQIDCFTDFKKCNLIKDDSQKDLCIIELGQSNIYKTMPLIKGYGDNFKTEMQENKNIIPVNEKKPEMNLNDLNNLMNLFKLFI